MSMAEARRRQIKHPAGAQTHGSHQVVASTQQNRASARAAAATPRRKNQPAVEAAA